MTVLPTERRIMFNGIHSRFQMIFHYIWSLKLYLPNILLLGKCENRQFTELNIADPDASMIYREEVPKS